jgi:hypothetical protein
VFGKVDMFWTYQLSYADMVKSDVVLSGANLQVIGQRSSSPSLSFAHLLSEQEFFELQDLLAAGYGFEDLTFYFKNGVNGSTRKSFMDSLSANQSKELCSIIASKPSSDQLRIIFGPANFAAKLNAAPLIGGLGFSEAFI